MTTQQITHPTSPTRARVAALVAAVAIALAVTAVGLSTWQTAATRDSDETRSADAAGARPEVAPLSDQEMYQRRQAVAHIETLILSDREAYQQWQALGSAHVLPVSDQEAHQQWLERVRQPR